MSSAVYEEKEEVITKGQSGRVKEVSADYKAEPEGLKLY